MNEQRIVIAAPPSDPLELARVVLKIAHDLLGQYRAVSVSDVTFRALTVAVDAQALRPSETDGGLDFDIVAMLLRAAQRMQWASFDGDKTELARWMAISRPLFDAAINDLDRADRRARGAAS